MNNQEDEIERMKEELEDYKQRLNEHSKDTDLLKHLFEIGHIDIDENPINKDKLQYQSKILRQKVKKIETKSQKNWDKKSKKLRLIKKKF